MSILLAFAFHPSGLEGAHGANLRKKKNRDGRLNGRLLWDGLFAYFCFDTSLLFYDDTQVLLYNVLYRFTFLFSVSNGVSKIVDFACSSAL